MNTMQMRVNRSIKQMLGAACVWVAGTVAVLGATITVGPGVTYDHTTITAAITAATAGDTIQVAAGTYSEQVVVTKQLTIAGANAGISAGAVPGTRGTETIIVGGFLVQVPAHGSVIDGFTIQNGYQYGSHLTGIIVGGGPSSSLPVTDVTIANNIIKDCVGTQVQGIETVAGANNLTIKNNEIVGNFRGVYLNPASGTLIEGNAIHGNNAGGGVGIASSGQVAITVTGNKIYDQAAEGWGMDTLGTGAVATNNAFYNNLVSVAHYSGATLDASKNYWGAATGPGATVSGSVSTTPYYTDAAMTTLYAPVKNITHVGYYTTIQSAIDAATAGDTIEVAAGTYNEDLVVDKSLEFRGANYNINPTTSSRGAESIIKASSRAFSISTGNIDVSINGFKFDGGSPMHDGNDTNNPQTSDVIFSNNIVVHSVAIYAGTSTSWKNLTIKDNVFEDVNGATNASALQLINLNTATITGNSFKNVDYAAILLDGISQSTVTGNTITTTGAQAIQLANTIGSATVNNNTITDANSTLKGADRGAIRLYGSGFTGTVLISGNTISGGYSGITIKDGQNISGKDITVTHNNITGLTAGKAIYNGGTGTLNAIENWYGMTAASAVYASISGDVQFLPFSTSADPMNDEGIGPVVNNNQGTSYMTIQAAVNAAAAGDTIEVAVGTYVGNIEVNKANLTLKSTTKHGAIIQTQAGFNAGSGYGGVTVLADGVTIDGFKIEQGVGQAVIHTHNASNVTIQNNLIVGLNNVNPRGIDVGYAGQNSAHVLLQGNTFNDLYCGVYINQATDLTIYGNHFERMGDGGVVFDGTWAFDGVVVQNNSATDANYLLFYLKTSGTVTPTVNTPLVNTLLSNFNVLNATKGKLYGTIQAAIDAASAGDTIEVAEGTYVGNIEVNKASLTLKSTTKHGAIIQTQAGFNAGSGYGGVTVLADGVTIDGFKIVQSAAQAIIHTHDSDNVTIKNNWIENASPPSVQRGIDVGYAAANSANVKIEGNTFNDLYCGVYINQATDLLINTNHFERMGDGGVVFDGTWAFSNVVVQNNSATDANYLLFYFKTSGTVTPTANTPLVNTLLSNFNVLNTTGETLYGTIQSAIDASSANDTIAVPTGTYTENVNASVKIVALAAGASPGQVTINGNFTLGSGNTLPVELNGLAPGTDYDQWIVNGAVTLGGATLSITVGHTYTAGDTVVLIANDGTDSVVGTFAGLAQGATLTVDSQDFVIFYNGGDGNDVVLMRKLATFDTVYVDDNFANSVLGSDPDGTNSPALYYGFDSFATIQDAVNAVNAGGTIDVAAGTYTEHVYVNQSLAILGAGAATTIVDGNAAGSVFFVDGDIDVSIAGLTLQNGSDEAGGGLYVQAGSAMESYLAVTDCVFKNNVATTGNGGALANLGLFEQVNLNGCTFNGNSASTGQGGAVSIIDGDLTMVNCTVSGNTAKNGGGFAFNSGAVIDLQHLTITLNTAIGTASSKGGGLSLGGASGTVVNSIICGNTDQFAGTTTDNVNGALPSGSTPNLIDQDAKLAALSNYGGSTPTHALHQNSDAVNAGSASAVETDQRGLLRPQGSSPDIGAYELQAPTCELVAKTTTYNGSAQAANVPTVTDGTLDSIAYRLDGTTGAWQTSVKDAGNYDVQVTVTGEDLYYLNITSEFDAALKITPAELTVTGITNNKDYDGTADGNLDITGITLTGIVGTEDVVLDTTGAGVPVYGSSAAGVYTVTVTGLSLSGTAKANYTLTQPTLSNATITPKPLTLTGLTASDKTYNQSTTAAITSYGTLDGIIGSDTVTLVTTATGAAANFSDASAANNKTVTVTGLTLDGASAANYSIADQTTTASIQSKPLTVTGLSVPATKEYDGSTGAAVSGTPTFLTSVAAPGADADGAPISGDTVAFTGTAAANYNSQYVADATTVTFTGLGSSNPDYTITPPTQAAGITPKTLAIGGTFTADSRVYNGDATATVADSTGLTLPGKLTSDDVTLTGLTVAFADKAAAAGKTVSITAASLAGAQAGNYTVTTVSAPTATATISPFELTIGGTFSAPNKEYDGTPSATINVNNTLTLVTKLGADVVTLATPTVAFADAAIATAKTVSITAASLTGADAGNYTVALTGAPTTTADITQKTLTIGGTFTAKDKVYNRFTDATINVNSLTLVTPVGTETVTLDAVVLKFASENVAGGIAVTIDSAALAGADAAHYTLSLTGAPTAAAAITKAPLTVTGLSTVNRYYDSTLVVTLSGTPSLLGAISPDVVNFTGAAVGSVGTKDVGAAKPVTLGGLTLAVTPPSSNYQITGFDTAKTVQFFPGRLTIAGLVAQSKPYDGTTTATIVDTAKALTGVFTADLGVGKVTLLGSATSGTFSQVNVGTGLLVSANLAGLSLDGTEKSNYEIDLHSTYNGVTAELRANINRRALSVTPTAGLNKIYGATDPTFLYTHSGEKNGETATFTGALSRAAGETVGAAYAILTGNLALADNGTFKAANYSLTFTAGVTFEILAKNASTFTVGAVGPLTYSGAAQTPEPTVSDGATTLVKGTDYTLSYAANTDAGTLTATLTVTGIGNYTGTQDKTFTIDPKTLTVTPTAGQTKIFGAADPVFAYGHSGEENAEVAAFDGALARVGGEPVGTYAILAGNLALADNLAFKAANYTLSFTADVTFAILAKNASTFTVGDVGPLTYSGLAQTPALTVLDGATTLVKDTDYTLSYAANTDAGTATLTVTGIGNYTATQNKTFTIGAKALTVTPTAAQSKIYGATDPTFLYTHSGEENGETAAFTGALVRDAGEIVGTYAILTGNLALADNGTFKAANYSLSFTAGETFAILAKNASTLAIADVAALTYSGAAQTPTPEVKDGATVLTLGTDYTLSYADNTDKGTATLTVTGKGNYTATQSKTFVIGAKTLTVTPTTGQSKIYGATDPVFAYGNSGTVNGETAGFTGALSRGTGETVGTAYAILAGNLALADNGTFKAANYTLSFTVDVTFEILAKNASTLTIGTMGPLTYNGAAQTPEPTVQDGTTTLVKDTDYTLSYAGNTDQGTATVTVTGKGNYTAAQAKTFTIGAKTLTVTPTAAQNKTYGEADPVYAYGNSGAVDGETAGFTGALSRGTGETVGTAYAILAGNLALADNAAFKAANYALSFTAGVTFEIKAKNASTLTLGAVGPLTYSGLAQTPEPTVHDGAALLVKGTDYTLSYAANTDAGTATLTVTGIGNYTGTQDKSFTIGAQTLTVTPTAGQSKIYGATDPAIAYGNSGAVVGQTAAFTGALSRDAGAGVGTYAILVNDLALADNAPFKAANYALSFTAGVTFEIVAKNASTFTIADVAALTYSGAAQTPTPEVKDGVTVLTLGTDYTLSYAANTDAGTLTATLTVTGKGNYSGTQDKTFTIGAKTLTVTPTAAQSKIYGATDPAFAYGNSGAVVGQTAAFAGALGRAPGTAIGTYAILAGNLALADNLAFKAANYTLSFTADVTFAILAKNASTFTVGDVGPFTYSGLAQTPAPTVQDGATLLTLGTDYTLSYAANTDAGTLTATLTVTGIGNYTGTQDKTFTISQKTLTVTPTAGQSKIYGATDPTFLYTHSGEENGEIAGFDGALARAAGEPVNTYTILVGGLTLKDNGAFKAANYQVSFAAGVTFEITKATLTVTAENKNKEYDGQVFAAAGYTVSYSHFVNGETSAVLGGALVFEGTAIAAVNADEYVITPKGLTSDNYAITFVNGTLTINRSPVTISGLSTPNRTYDTTPNASIEGLGAAALAGTVNGDDVIIGGTVSGTFADKNAANGRLVTVNLSQVTLGGDQGGNYTLTGVTTRLTANITPRWIDISGLVAKDKPYDGNKDAAIDDSLKAPTGALPGDEPKVALAGTITLGTFASKDVGVHSVAVVLLPNLSLTGDESQNYYIRDVSAPLSASITAKELTVTGVTDNKTYDGTKTPNLNTTAASLVGVVDTEAVTLVTAGATAADYGDKVVGTYTVAVSGLTLAGADKGNYSLTQPTLANAKIAKADATVVVAPYSVTYDGQEHSATVTSITGVNEETGATVGSVTLTTTHTEAGTYTGDTWSFTGAANYNDIAATTLTDTISMADPTVTVTVGSYTYSGAAQGPDAVTLSPAANSGAVTWSYAGTGGTTYEASATKPTAAGTYTATASVEADANNNAVVSAATAFAISLANPVVSQWPTTKTMLIGNTLGAVEFLTPGTVNVSGVFAFANPSTVPDAGPSSYQMTFTPENPNYEVLTQMVTVRRVAASHEIVEADGYPGMVITVTSAFDFPDDWTPGKPLIGLTWSLTPPAGWSIVPDSASTDISGVLPLVSGNDILFFGTLPAVGPITFSYQVKVNDEAAAGTYNLQASSQFYGGGYEPGNTVAYADPLGFQIHTLANEIQTVTHSSRGFFSPSTYMGPMTVTNTFQANGKLVSLNWMPKLPAGWQLVAVSGDVGSPTVNGAFIDFTVDPEWPENKLIAFSYTVSVPGNATVIQSVEARVTFKTATMPQVGSYMVAGSAVYRYHSADYDGTKRKLGLQEVNRIVEYWRTGGYTPEPAAYDGYTGVSIPNTAIVQAFGRHSADYQGAEGTMDVNEASRALAIWRSTGYSVNVGNPSLMDGYSIGSEGAGPMSMLSAGLIGAEKTWSSSGSPGVQMSVDSSSYTPGGTLTVTAVFTVGPDKMLGLAWKPELPSGWRITSVEGSGSPLLGESDGSVLWVGDLPVSGPITLTLNVQVPIWEYRDVTIAGTGDLYVSGQNQPLAPTAQTEVLSFVDQNGDGIPDTFDSLDAFITAGVDLRIVAIQSTAEGTAIQWLGSPGRAQFFTVEQTDSLGGPYKVVGQGEMNIVRVINKETVVFGFTHQSAIRSGFYRVQAHNPLEY